MQFALLSAAATASLAITTMASPTTLTERQYPGKCAVGIETDGKVIPGAPVSLCPLSLSRSPFLYPPSPKPPKLTSSPLPSNTPIKGAYGYIVGTNNVQTNQPAYPAGGFEHAYSTGPYGGISGGSWYADTMIYLDRGIEDCTISFNGVTFTYSSRRNPGTYDMYSGASGKSGCRCRFDCQ